MPGSRVTRAMLSAAVLAVVAACSPAAPERAAPSAPATSPSAATPTSSPTATPTPSPSGPKDGTKTRACADGTCEVRVNGSARVPLPKRFGLSSLKVTGIEDEMVSFVAPMIGSKFSSDGGCSATVTGPTGNSAAFWGLTCGAGDTTVVNKMSLEVVGVTGGAAVIRIRPA
ncbi:hypothetical protein ACFWYW_21890 [Nonomuraea sp. NPDC059023]|uniref:hypothetical protein n=1 Tax=unclassified Nonomuraea TaxID=2593643 RepID=UPI00369DE6C7